MATDPDTLYWSAIKGDSSGWSASADFCQILITPFDTGTIELDTATLPGLGPLSFLDSNGQEIPIVWVPRFYHAQPHAVSFTTSIESRIDTLEVGEPASIIFKVNTANFSATRLAFPVLYSFSGNNLIGPIAKPGDIASYDVSPNLGFWLENISWDSTLGNGGNPDTTLLTAENTVGSGYHNNSEIWSLTFIPLDTGFIVIDTPGGTVGAWPGRMGAWHSEDSLHPVIWRPETLRVMEAEPIYLDAEACPAAPYSTTEGGAAAAYVEAVFSAGTLDELNLHGMTRDGVAAVPIHPPILLGLNQEDVPTARELIMHWVTAPGDAGIWEFEFVGRTNFGFADTISVTIPVDSALPNSLIWEPRRFTYDSGTGSFGATLKIDVTTALDPLYGMVIGNIMRTVAGGAFFASPILAGDVTWPAAFDVFEAKSVNDYNNNAVSPDSIIMGLISFSSGLGPGSYTVSISTSLNPSEGIIYAEFPSLCFPPASGCASFNDEAGGWYEPATGDGCWPVTMARNAYMGGDCDESGDRTSADIIYLVNYVFKGSVDPLPCVAMGDVNCDQAITSSDLIVMVNHVFKGMAPPCDIDQLIPGIWQCP